MKVLIINETCGIGSHGKICADIAESFASQGNEVKIAYGRDFFVPEKYKKYAIKIGNKLNVYWHGLMSRLFDKHGLASKRATRRFLKWADDYNPDLIWLHNIHGYYINYQMLFKWIKSKDNIQVKWTLHDCWAFTGHCAHFMYVKCDKWKTQCSNCPNKHEYPASLLFDNSKKNFLIKKESFSGIKNMKIICPSNWLKTNVEQSFLKDYEITVIKNTIDLKSFKKQDNDLRRKLNLSDKFIVLGVASSWSVKKGLNDFYKLSSILDDKEYSIVLIGLTKKQIKKAPKNVICIERTNSKEELACYYSMANVFVNLTYEDNYPTVNLEAEACGTKVITYDTGGCKETVGNSSFVIETGNLEAVIQQIYKLNKE